MDFPKLRNINIFPVQMSGQTFLCLQDPQSISEKTFFLPLPLYFILSLFDGKHSLLDIQTEYMRRFGEFLYTEKLQEIIQQLDESLFLEGERFQEVLKEKEEKFKNSPFREPAFSGKSYEARPEKLKIQLEGYFNSEDSPEAISDNSEEMGLKGVVSPHIDFHRGGNCYAFSHREIKKRNPHSCFIIFGVSHAPMKQFYSLTRKDFITPLGSLNVDKELVDFIQSRCPYDLFEDEVIHRSEHSIEFQSVFLRYIYPEPMNITIVPILCGSFHEAILRGISPQELLPVRQFIEALKESVSSMKREVCYIASADLSHIGLQFGDSEGIREERLKVLERVDLEMLEYVEKLDGEGFYSYIQREQDRRRVCGFPAIYTMLKVIEANKGRLLRYCQAYTRETQSVVTFASLAFY